LIFSAAELSGKSYKEIVTLYSIAEKAPGVCVCLSVSWRPGGGRGGGGRGSSLWEPQLSQSGLLLRSRG
jgi:hypothetical protein